MPNLHQLYEIPNNATRGLRAAIEDRNKLATAANAKWAKAEKVLPRRLTDKSPALLALLAAREGAFDVARADEALDDALRMFLGRERKPGTRPATIGGHLAPFALQTKTK